MENPSESKIQEHYFTHLPHATSCRYCVWGRMVNVQSISVPKDERLIGQGNIIQLDNSEFESTRKLIMV